MSEFTWSDEAVDAAAKALCDEWPMVSRDLRARWESLYPLRDPGVPEAWLVRAVLAALAPFVSAMLDEAKAERSLPRHDPPDLRYDLRLRLNRAMRWLREAEDLARVEMPAWPTADRIRDIYEQVGEDVLNGKTSVPPIRQRLAAADAAGRRLAEAGNAVNLAANRLLAAHMEDRDGAEAALDEALTAWGAALAECPWEEER